jgi:hypothetical protein
MHSSNLQHASRAYRLCLLQHLPGTQSDVAASRIQVACRHGV